MPHNISQIKAAIFDIGATLVTGPPVAPNKVIASLIDGATAADVSSVIMTTEIQSAEHACSILEKRFGRLSGEAVMAVCELWKSQSTAPEALGGAAETVLTIKNRGLKIGLLSDIWSPYYAGVERVLPEVVEASDAIVLSCRTGVRKPDTSNFRTAIDALGVEASEALMVGDTYTHDILPALELGMKAVWVLARPERESESIIRILNGEVPVPTITVASVGEVASLRILNVDMLTQERVG
ncbi:MAG: HAD family hydrolase [Armatimonadota bacterium]|nr:HAD family hydrolase [bacterium]